MKKLLFALLIIGAILTYTLTASGRDKDQDVALPYLEKSQELAPEITKPLSIVSQPVKRRITAYNLLEGQTDGNPCQSASGVDICPLVASGELVCAANFVPFGTILRIDGLGDCMVLDRMNQRYPYDVDIAMPADMLGEAKEFGVKWLGVGIVYRQ